MAFLMPNDVRNGLLSFDIIQKRVQFVVIFNPKMLTKCAQFYFKSKLNKPSLTQLGDVHHQTQFRHGIVLNLTCL